MSDFKPKIGTNEAANRVEAMFRQHNTGRIEYPKGTNERGSGGREHHAAGDMVGNGGSREKPNFGKPVDGMEKKNRSKAVAQSRGENHKHGDRVGREHHGWGDFVGGLGNMAGNSLAGPIGGQLGSMTGNLAGNAGESGFNGAKGLFQPHAMGDMVSHSNHLRVPSPTGGMNSTPPRPMYRKGGRTRHHHMED